MSSHSNFNNFKSTIMPTRPHTSQGQYSSRDSPSFTSTLIMKEKGSSHLFKLSMKMGKLWSKFTPSKGDKCSEAIDTFGIAQSPPSDRSFGNSSLNSDGELTSHSSHASLHAHFSSSSVYQEGARTPCPVSPSSSHSIRRSASWARCISSNNKESDSPSRLYVPATLHFCPLDRDPFAAAPLLRRVSHSSRSIRQVHS